MWTFPRFLHRRVSQGCRVQRSASCLRVSAHSYASSVKNDIINLSSIAEQTKIKRSLLEALERDDVSLWPSGVSRRAYIRTYAQIIGLDPDVILREFLQLYPEPVDVLEAAAAAAIEETARRKCGAGDASAHHRGLRARFAGAAAPPRCGRRIDARQASAQRTAPTLVDRPAIAPHDSAAALVDAAAPIRSRPRSAALTAWADGRSDRRDGRSRQLA